MIDPEAIDRWIARPLRDSATAKRFTRAALDRKLAKLEPPPRFEMTPRTHQLAAFLLGAANPGYYLALDMGLGKTMVALSLFRWRRDRGEARRALVLVPSTSNVDEWRMEIDKHAPELTVALLDTSVAGEEREARFWGDADIVVATYRGFLLQVTRTRAGSMELWPSKLAKGAGAFGMLIADESTAVANPDAITTRALRRFTAKIPYRLCMSGTPFSSDPQGLWSQFAITDQGATLGPSIGLFREAFFSRKQGEYAVSYELRRRLEPRLHRMLRNGALRYEASECLDLPECTGGIANPLIRSVRMSKTQARHVLGLESEMHDAHTEDDTDGVQNVYLRMRYLSSGYIPTDDGPHAFEENPKIDALLQLLDEAPAHKFVVFIHYKASADLIIKALKRKRISYAEVSGRISNKGAELAKFRGDARILIGSRAAATGLNLQFCSRIVFFETPDSIAMRKQAERRIYRMGQRHPCFVYDLAMRGTYDMRIINALREGKRVLDAVVDGVEDIGGQHAVFA